MKVYFLYNKDNEIKFYGLTYKQLAKCPEFNNANVMSLNQAFSNGMTYKGLSCGSVEVPDEEICKLAAKQLENR